jgi:hypothetical protein
MPLLVLGAGIAFLWLVLGVGAAGFWLMPGAGLAGAWLTPGAGVAFLWLVLGVGAAGFWLMPGAGLVGAWLTPGAGVVIRGRMAARLSLPRLLDAWAPRLYSNIPPEGLGGVVTLPLASGVRAYLPL